MKCGGCEAHVQDVIRRNLTVKKVKASHLKNNVVIITDRELSIDEFKQIIGKSGYEITSFNKEEATKKLFIWR